MSRAPETPAFPSLQWFEALRRLVNSDPRLRRLGSCDMRVGVQVDDVHVEVVFEAFECTEIRALSEAETQTSCDFILAMDVAQWRAMLDNIRAHRGADPRRTLNSLELPKILHVRETADYDTFYQYNQTLQFFFDTAARLDIGERLDAMRSDGSAGQTQGLASRWADLYGNGSPGGGALNRAATRRSGG